MIAIQLKKKVNPSKNLSQDNRPINFNWLNTRVNSTMMIWRAIWNIFLKPPKYNRKASPKWLKSTVQRRNSTKTVQMDRTATYFSWTGMRRTRKKIVSTSASWRKIWEMLFTTLDMLMLSVTPKFLPNLRFSNRNCLYLFILTPILKNIQDWSAESKINLCKTSLLK